MNGYDGPSPGSDGALDLARIEIKRVILNIHEDRVGAHVGNGPAGGNESKRRGDNLIARPEVQQAHGHVEGRGAAIEANAVLRGAELREVLLELRHIRPQAKTALIECPPQRSINLRSNRAQLRRQVEVRDWSVE